MKRYTKLAIVKRGSICLPRSWKLLKGYPIKVVLLRSIYMKETLNVLNGLYLYVGLVNKG